MKGDTFTCIISVDLIGMELIEKSMKSVAVAE